MKRVLILSGKQGAGKSANSKSICADLSSLGYYPKTFRFAEILYQMHDPCLKVLKAAGIRPETMVKDGELLQALGTEFGRNRLGENVWVDALRKQVDRFLNEPSDELALIDDCRFENEFLAFPDAFKVRLICNRDIRKARCSYWREDENHPSETGLDDFDERGLFDFYIDTSQASVETVSLEIRRAWMSR